MKKLTKLTVALLTLVMAFSLCACGANLEKDIVGTWKIDYDMGDQMAAEMGEDFADFDSSLEITLKFDFDEDGEYKMYADDSFKDNFEAWLDDVTVYSVEMMYETYEEMGMTREDVDTLIKDEFGMTLEEYFAETLKASMDVDALMDQMVREGEYKVEGNKLFLSDEDGDFDEDAYDVCTIDGDIMTLETPDGDDMEVLPGLSYPLELERD